MSRRSDPQPGPQCTYPLGRYRNFNGSVGRSDGQDVQAGVHEPDLGQTRTLTIVGVDRIHGHGNRIAFRNSRSHRPEPRLEPHGAGRDRSQPVTPFPRSIETTPSALDLTPPLVSACENSRLNEDHDQRDEPSGNRGERSDNQMGHRENHMRTIRAQSGRRAFIGTGGRLLMRGEFDGSHRVGRRTGQPIFSAGGVASSLQTVRYLRKVGARVVLGSGLEAILTGRRGPPHPGVRCAVAAGKLIETTWRAPSYGGVTTLMRSVWRRRENRTLNSRLARAVLCRADTQPPPSGLSWSYFLIAWRSWLSSRTASGRRRRPGEQPCGGIRRLCFARPTRQECS